MRTGGRRRRVIPFSASTRTPGRHCQRLSPTMSSGVTKRCNASCNSARLGSALVGGWGRSATDLDPRHALHFEDEVQEVVYAGTRRTRRYRVAVRRACRRLLFAQVVDELPAEDIAWLPRTQCEVRDTAAGCGGARTSWSGAERSKASNRTRISSCASCCTKESARDQPKDSVSSVVCGGRGA